MQKQSDIELITMLRSPKQLMRNKALRLIYQDNFTIIAAFINQNSGRPEDAEDIFQDGLIALYEQAIDGRYRGASTIKTYLFAICRNLWMKRLRKASTKNESYGEGTDFVGEENLVVDKIIADEESKYLADLLDQLEGNCKKILLLYYYDRKRMKEIATMMGFANAQVAKNKKTRCLKKLKELAHKNPES